jgi:hypothetical protein
MRYDEYIRLGYGIGSGAVESAHKQVIHSRFRQAGMRWSEAGARRLLALRLLLLNDQWTLLDSLRMVPSPHKELIPTLTQSRSFNHAPIMPRHSSPTIPPDLRSRLETARLDLLALFRALDRMDLSPAEIPQRLIRQLFELDADYVEALWALDQNQETLDLRAMLRDTLAALDQLPSTTSRFKKYLPKRALPTLAALVPEVRKSLSPSEAYNMVPGIDPQTS